MRVFFSMHCIGPNADQVNMGCFSGGGGSETAGLVSPYRMNLGCRTRNWPGRSKPFCWSGIRCSSTTSVFGVIVNTRLKHFAPWKPTSDPWRGLITWQTEPSYVHHSTECSSIALWLTASSSASLFPIVGLCGGFSPGLASHRPSVNVKALWGNFRPSLPSLEWLIGSVFSILALHCTHPSARPLPSSTSLYFCSKALGIIVAEQPVIFSRHPCSFSTLRFFCAAGTSRLHVYLVYTVYLFGING